MNKLREPLLSSLGLSCCLGVSCAATAMGDLASAEADVRKADAAWAAAAGTGNVDAWMAFCSTDAIVLLPREPLANGAEAVRAAVTRLLALPHLVLQWHATRVDMGPSADLAQVLGAYELTYADAGGALLSERGSVVEIWRKQPGSWKCLVDSWIADGSTANPATPTSVPMPAGVTKYGDEPVNYPMAIRHYFQERLKDPESMQIQDISIPEKGFMKAVTGALLMSETREYGWIVKATINARNSHGRYVGLKTYQFLFHGEQLIRALAPLPEDEIK